MSSIGDIGPPFFFDAFDPNHWYAGIDQRFEILGAQGEEHADHAIDPALPRPIEKMPLGASEGRPSVLTAMTS